LATIGPFIQTYGEQATWQNRGLGGRVAPTNWPTETYPASTIYIMVKETQTREVDTPAGRVTEKRINLWTTAALSPQDQIIYPALVGNTYEVESEGTPFYLFGTVWYRRFVAVLTA